MQMTESEYSTFKVTWLRIVKDIKRGAEKCNVDLSKIELIAQEKAEK